MESWHLILNVISFENHKFLILSFSKVQRQFIFLFSYIIYSDFLTEFSRLKYWAILDLDFLEYLRR